MYLDVTPDRLVSSYASAASVHYHIERTSTTLDWQFLALAFLTVVSPESRAAGRVGASFALMVADNIAIGCVLSFTSHAAISQSLGCHFVDYMVQRGPVGELVILRRIGADPFFARDRPHNESDKKVVLGVHSAPAAA